MLKQRSSSWVPVVIATCTIHALMAANAHTQTILRVDASATDPTPDGSTWPKAFPHLQDALAVASGIASPANPVQIWVAAGTYMPRIRAPPLGPYLPAMMSSSL